MFYIESNYFIFRQTTQKIHKKVKPILSIIWFGIFTIKVYQRLTSINRFQMIWYSVLIWGINLMNLITDRWCDLYFKKGTKI